MIAMIGWVSFFFFQFIIVGGRHIEKDSLTIPVPVEDPLYNLSKESEEISEAHIWHSQSTDGTEETGDELFLKVRPKTIDMAPSESDYEDEVKNSEEDSR